MDKRKNSSSIWSYFAVKDAEKKLATCDLCGLLMSYRGTISNLKSHLSKKHPTINLNLESNTRKSSASATNICSSSSLTPINNEQQQSSHQYLQPTPTPVDSSQKQSGSTSQSSQQSIITYMPKKIGISQKKKIDQLLVRLFTQDFQPFSIVEDSGFRDFVKALNPSYELPSRKVISNNFVAAAFEACKSDVMKKMENTVQVCLTTDCWSSCNNDSYLALTAHFINASFQLESVLLDCLPIEGSHTSKNLAETITDSYKISKKVLIVVSDNAANIVGAINELGWKHFGCYAHTINLIVKDALQSVQDLQAKARHIVSFFKRSNLATEKLMKFQRDSGENNPKKLIQDVITRWNSTFMMLQRLVELQDAVKTSLALSERDHINLTPDEWKMCGELVEVLEPFENITRQMSGERFVTGSQVIVLTAGITHVCSILQKKPYKNAVVHEVVADLYKGILTRLKNIEHSKTLGICTFLDPRFKQHAFSSQSAVDTVKNYITKRVTHEYNKDKKITSVETVERAEAEEPQQKKAKQELSIWGFIDQKLANLPQENPSSSAIMEVQRYSQETVIDRKEDPLKWWQENHHHYPYLAKIVRYSFPMVATSVPCERVFSKTGLLINDRRTRLKRNKVQQLIFLRENS